LRKVYPEVSPYCFAVNSPLRFVDVFGLGAADRIKKGRSFTGTEYSQDKALNQGTELRTGSSKEALAYLDCSEFVCRVMHADGITKTVKQMNTEDLIKFLNN